MIDDPEDAMPCGHCCVCGIQIDHTRAGFCVTCGRAFHWTRCGGWGGPGHQCSNCNPDDSGD